MKRKRIAIIFGGKSAEHEVSIHSAKNVVAALNKEKYEKILIKIEKNGEWKCLNDAYEEDRTKRIVPCDHQGDFSVFDHETRLHIDVVFPVLHGPYGEDGSIQGLLKIANIAFVGAGVLGSAIGMDKGVMKRLLREKGLLIGDFIVVRYGEKIIFTDIAKKLGSEFFVKPANLGSSVGISKVCDEKSFEKAIELAFSYDNKVIIEKSILGREIECSVLGNNKPRASRCGEIVPKKNFYSYESKYTDGGADLIIPAKIDAEIEKEIQSLAVKVYETLECSGMGRVDFFLTEDHKIFINEINTIPGFTAQSMYPQLWEISGLKYANLIDKLIQLAEEKYAENRRLLSHKI
ncbi:MAG: D-alanine--D-alanine ligase A [Candidatus Moraniibacteriota bacterium]|nr:MAG: D-alanine--D-alanine ligase A [Candidatus Moranbacteria bacterium]